MIEGHVKVMYMLYTKTCQECKIEFVKHSDWKKKYWEKRIFCLRKCYQAANDKKWEQIICKFCKKSFSALKNDRRTYCSASCRSKDGNFGASEKHQNWKGDEVGYWGVHKWIARNWGNSTKCEKCGRDALKGRQINWANKTGKYLRDRNDWLRLCRLCHARFDKFGFLAHKRDQNGKNNGFYGRYHSEETKKKISAANKGRKKLRSHKIYL